MLCSANQQPVGHSPLDVTGLDVTGQLNRNDTSPTPENLAFQLPGPVTGRAAKAPVMMTSPACSLRPYPARAWHSRETDRKGLSICRPVPAVTVATWFPSHENSTVVPSSRKLSAGTLSPTTTPQLARPS